METIARNTNSTISTRYNAGPSFGGRSVRQSLFWNKSKKITSISEFRLLEDEAIEEMMEGSIPNLKSVCYDLFNTFSQRPAPYNALQFVDVLQHVAISSEALKRFEKNPKTNHILIQNQFLKVLLIHWQPGEETSIHGHAQGGCVFKVLKGRVTESRYTPDARQKFLSKSTYNKGALAYLDDRMAHHAVGNPFQESAISIHAYTPGDKTINH